MENVDDGLIPLDPPRKYAFMQHSEKSALLNLTVATQLIEGAEAYITGFPCNACLQDLYSANIRTLHVINRKSMMMDCDDFRRDRELLDHLLEGKMTVNVVEMKPQWERHLMIANPVG